MFLSWSKPAFKAHSMFRALAVKPHPTANHSPITIGAHQLHYAVGYIKTSPAERNNVAIGGVIQAPGH